MDPAWQGSANSQVISQNVAIDALQAEISDMLLLQDDWNGYGAPRPTEAAISAARSIVRKFRSLLVIPEKVSASADGGVALIFVGAGSHRAVIESFGTADDYVLLYDTKGNSHILPWPDAYEAQNNVLGELQTFLRDPHVAALR
jgi:hypothetical protein